MKTDDHKSRALAVLFETASHTEHQHKHKHIEPVEDQPVDDEAAAATADRDATVSTPEVNDGEDAAQQPVSLQGASSFDQGAEAVGTLAADGESDSDDQGLEKVTTKTTKKATEKVVDAADDSDDDDDDDDKTDKDDKDDTPTSFLQSRMRVRRRAKEAEEMEEQEEDASDDSAKLPWQEKKSQTAATNVVHVDQESKVLLQSLQRGLQDLIREDQESANEQSKLFRTDTASEQHAHATALAQQRALNATRVSLLNLQDKLSTAVGHLEETRSHLQDRIHSLGLYLQRLAHLLLAPPKETGAMVGEMPKDVPIEHVNVTSTTALIQKK